MLPTFVESPDFASATPTQLLPTDADGLSAVAFDPATAKLYELLYVHKICPGAMTIVRNG